MKNIKFFLITYLIKFFSFLESRGYPWYRLPGPLSRVALIISRERLRRNNLYAPMIVQNSYVPSTPLERCGRTTDGSYTDLNKPYMGMANTPFGRNVPPAFEFTDPPESLMSPNPREISSKLLARDKFEPATTLNLLAAAWIQFQIHGWMRHMHDSSHWLEIPIDKDDPWPHQKPMKIPSSLSIENKSSSSPERKHPAFINDLAHWWDGGQVYGYEPETVKKIRSFQKGKLNILDDGLLPIDPRDGIDITGMRDNWWVGSSLMHTLFTLEHNAICDDLILNYPAWSDDDLYRTARLINAALMSKIHTIEWTPAILNDPNIILGLNATWYGLNKLGHSLLAKILNDKVLGNGVLGSDINYHGVDFSLTEEFVSVYRMHPLIPDLITFHSVRDGSLIATKPMLDLAGPNARSQIQNNIPMSDLFYSFGIEHPGAISLHNYPDFLRDLQPQPLHPDAPPNPRIDLGAIDILRDRERGVPRYNLFRKAFGLPQARSFEELTGGDIKLAQEIQEVYKEIDHVDLMVGLFAEPKAPGCGFSSTAILVFLLMATRRIEADRFYTKDYNDKVYTSIGLKWVEKNTMQTVLLRHYPELLPALRKNKNAFAPWDKVES